MTVPRLNRSGGGMALNTSAESALLVMRRSFQRQEFRWRVGGNSNGIFKIEIE